MPFRNTVHNVFFDRCTPEGKLGLPVTLLMYYPASNAVRLVCSVVNHSKLKADWFACRLVERQQTHRPLIDRELGDWDLRRGAAVVKILVGGI